MKTRIGIAMLVLGCLIAMSVYAAEEGAKETTAATAPSIVTAARKSVSLQTEMEKISYIIGTQIAQNMKTALGQSLVFLHGSNKPDSG